MACVSCRETKTKMASDDPGLLCQKRVTLNLNQGLITHSVMAGSRNVLIA